MSNFTLNTISAHIASNLSSLSGDLRFTDRDDVAEMLRDELDSNNYDAPEVIYYADGWEVVAGGQFNNYECADLDFSGCDSATACVMQEANGLVYQAYSEMLDSALQEVAEAVQEVLDLQLTDMRTGKKFYISEVEQVSGCALGYLPHDIEEDLAASGASSVCVWFGSRRVYFTSNGLELAATLEEEDTDTDTDGENAE